MMDVLHGQVKSAKKTDRQKRVHEVCQKGCFLPSPQPKIAKNRQNLPNSMKNKEKIHKMHGIQAHFALHILPVGKKCLSFKAYSALP
jgi:hypothetical protein